MNETISWWQGMILGLLQGVAEYLPVSSSGHLAIVELLFGLHLPISVDVLLHLATLIPTIWIFRARIASLLASCWKLIRIALPTGRMRGQGPASRQPLEQPLLAEWKYLASILVATLGTVVTALPQMELGLKYQPDAIAAAFLFTALLLYLQHFLRHRSKPGGQKLLLGSAQSLCAARWGRALLAAACVGLAQGVAALPGVSRSAMTISTCLLLGCKRREAGEFSFLISIPVILGALLVDLPELQKLLTSARLPGGELAAILLAFGTACISGFIALRLLLFLLQNERFYLFSIYLVIVSVLVFWYF